MTAALTSTDPVLDAFASEVGSDDAVAIGGNRTRWTIGGLPSADARILPAPSGIVDYKPEEMTVTVRAGTTVADLHGELAAAGQRTGLPERGGTVGGAFAVGENGLYPLGRARLRTALLQVRYVSAEGEIVTGGGPTVKNVSGFDIPRLMVGSLGTLGCIAECIIRTNPIPAVSRWFISEDADPFAVLSTVLHPSAVLWDGLATHVLLEGHAPAVEGEASQLNTIGTFTPSHTQAPPALPPERWSLAPAALRSLADIGSFVASIGVGTVWADTAQPLRPVDPAVAIVSERMKANFDPTGRLNPGRSVMNSGTG